jgi:hypothetical protein
LQNLQEAVENPGTIFSLPQKKRKLERDGDEEPKKKKTKRYPIPPGRCVVKSFALQPD